MNIYLLALLNFKIKHVSNCMTTFFDHFLSMVLKQGQKNVTPRTRPYQTNARLHSIKPYSVHSTLGFYPILPSIIFMHIQN